MKTFIKCLLFILAMPFLAYSGTQDPDLDHEGAISDIRYIKGDPENNNEIFQEANTLYADGKFDEAISLYNIILSSGYHSASLYYNNGNAYYRRGQIPRAILNYERALLLSPGDEDIKFNLELAGMHTKDRIETLPEFFLNIWWKSVRNSLSFRNWAILSVIAFIGTLLFLSVYLLARPVNVRKVFFWFAVLLFLVSAFSFTFGLDQRNYIKNNNSAIIFTTAISVKSSPDLNSTDLFVIHEGTKVSVEDSLGDWRAVRLSDGNKGWLHKDGLEMI